MRKINQGPVLRSRPARHDKHGKLTHRGTFFIDDVGSSPRQTPTGCSFGNDLEYASAQEDALVKLHEYNVAKFALKTAQGAPKGANLAADHVKIGDLILYYLAENADVLDKMPDHRHREHMSHVDCLKNFWGDRFVVEINRVNSLAYQKGKAQSVVRNKIIVLKSIINFAAGQTQVILGEGQLDYAQPPRLKSRIDFYEVDELIAMYKAAMRRKRTWREGRESVLKARGETLDDQAPMSNRRVARHIARFLLVAVMTGTRASRICNASFVREAGRPWIDLDRGIFYRSALGEDVAANKRADPIKVPDRLLRMMRRWHAGSAAVPGSRYLVEFNGRPVDCRKGFYTLKTEVLSEERAKVLNRHSLKHTAVTMLLADGVSVEAVARFVSTTPEIIREVYDQFIPDEFSEVHQALNRKRPRRPRPGEKMAA